MSELGEQLQERLRRKSLSPEEIEAIHKLAGSMRELHEKYAELARQHASLRTDTEAQAEC